MKVLGLIPARGGSKSVPDKNLRSLLGRSLVERTHDTAVASGRLARIILSTDDPRIAELGRSCGIDVPFMRPAALADDTSAMIGVAVHALEFLHSAGEEYDALLLLQPTSPLRQPGHIRTAVELLGAHDSVCSVVQVPPHLSPHYVMRITESQMLDFFLPDGAKYTRRQDVPKAYRREGTIFLTRSAVILQHRTFYGAQCVPMLLDAHDSLSIDDAADWAEAERRLLARE